MKWEDSKKEEEEKVFLWEKGTQTPQKKQLGLQFVDFY